MRQFISLIVSLLLLLPYASTTGNGALIPVVSLLLDESSSCSQQVNSNSDEFECDSLEIDDSPWQFVNRDSVNASINNGSLLLQLTQRQLWFDESRGVLMHRPIQGDFKATTKLSVFKTSDAEALPDQAVQLAGLMVRDPASDLGSENYLFVVAGFDVNDISVETKTTVNSVSDFEGPAWPDGDAELRICRRGGSFSMYKRRPGGSLWLAADDPDSGIDWPQLRPDLPNQLQLGLNIYTNIANFDVSVRYEYLRVEPVTSDVGCITD